MSCGFRRDTGKFEDSHLVDASVNYRLPIWRDLGPWLKLELISMFNRTPLIGSNIRHA